MKAYMFPKFFRRRKFLLYFLSEIETLFSLAWLKEMNKHTKTIQVRMEKSIWKELNKNGKEINKNKKFITNTGPKQ